MLYKLSTINLVIISHQTALQYQVGLSCRNRRVAPKPVGDRVECHQDSPYT